MANLGLTRRTALVGFLLAIALSSGTAIRLQGPHPQPHKNTPPKPKAVAQATTEVEQAGGLSISEQASKSNGLDLQDNLIQHSDFQDFVEQLQDGEYDDESFLATYQHETSSEDDTRFIRMMFNKYSEQAWDKSGQPIKDAKVLSKKGATKFAKEVIGNWQKLSSEENESYMQQNLDSSWVKFAGK